MEAKISALGLILSFSHYPTQNLKLPKIARKKIYIKNNFEGVLQGLTSKTDSLLVSITPIILSISFTFMYDHW